jgi:hypothetical protein
MEIHLRTRKVAPTFRLMHRLIGAPHSVVRGPLPPVHAPPDAGPPFPPRARPARHVRTQAPTQETTMEMVKLDMALLAALSSFAFLAAVVFGMV